MKRTPFASALTLSGALALVVLLAGCNARVEGEPFGKDARETREEVSGEIEYDGIVEDESPD